MFFYLHLVCICLLGPSNVDEPVQLLMKDAGKTKTSPFGFDFSFVRQPW